MVVLFVFQYLQPVPPPAQPNKAPAGQDMANATSSPAAADKSAVTPATPAPAQAEVIIPSAKAGEAEELVNVETDLYKAVFSTKGGTLKSFELKKYKAEDGKPVVLLRDGTRMRTLALGVSDNYAISENIFAMSGGDINIQEGAGARTLTFIFTQDGVSIKRVYTFKAGSYGFDLEDTVQGLPHYQIALGGDFGLFERDAQYLHVGPLLISGNEREEFKIGKQDKMESFAAPIKWIAIEDKYFASAIIVRDTMQEAIVWPEGAGTAIGMRGASGTHKLTIYGGPKDQAALSEVGGDMASMVDFGFFSPIARPIFWLLKKIHAIVGNYGVAIILLTIIIRVPFIPLVNKGQKSMKKLQELQPKVAELKKQYKNDSDRMNREMMQLYGKHKVNPVGGCLPMLLQIPVFFALYKVLMITIELRGAPFIFWIKDLSLADPSYIMPVFMGATMFLQQKMTPTGGDPKMKKMLMWMPVVFTFISLSFPSGLVLYWLVNNTLSITQQYFVNKSKDEEAA